MAEPGGLRSRPQSRTQLAYQQQQPLRQKVTLLKVFSGVSINKDSRVLTSVCMKFPWGKKPDFFKQNHFEVEVAFAWGLFKYFSLKNVLPTSFLAFFSINFNWS